MMRFLGYLSWVHEDDHIQHLRSFKIGDNSNAYYELRQDIIGTSNFKLGEIDNFSIV